MKYFVIALMVVLAGWGGWLLGRGGAADPLPALGGDQAAQENLNGATVTPEVPPPSPKPVTSKAPATSKQTEIPAPRIRLAQCVATPNAVTLKESSTLIVENLDYTTRKLNVDTQVLNIPPQSYVTIFASPVGIHSIVCDGAGVATLTVTP
ncbi:MAG: hypothetical protein Q8Q39_00065 [bacterium]|nr:hypothetical protein [bacterium]